MAKVRLDKRTGWWIADYKTASGVRVQRKAGRTKTQAEAVLRKILDEVGQEVVYGTAAVKQIVFEDFLKEYLSYSEKNKRPGSATRDKTSGNHLLEAFKGKRLIHITARDVQRFKDTRSTQVAQSTVNRELACLKNMFSKAIQWGYAKENPVKAVRLFRENNTIVRYLSQQEREMLITCCHDSIRSVVVFAIHTGMRKSEIFNLAWNEVDLEQKVLRVADSKNGQHRYIPINSTLQSLLKTIHEYRSIEDPRVFWNVVNFRKLWDAAIKRAKIVNFRFHDLRHTFASYMAMAGADLKTIQEILGHKSFAMTLRYAHLSASHKHAAVEKLSTVLGADGPAQVKNATQVQHGPQVAV